MNAEQILKLIDAVSRSELSELKFEGDGVKLTLKKAEDRRTDGPVAAVSSDRAAADNFSSAANEPAAAAVPLVQAAETAVQTAENTEKNAKQISGNIITSPLVGTFYAAPAEDAAPFVKTGDRVEKGQVLAIIEAMKLMNEIESDFAGTVAEILVENGQAVEYGQPLFVIQ